MTVASNTAKAGPYSGDGSTTEFTFSFMVQSAADVKVVSTVTTAGVQVDTELTVTTDYTVAINSDQVASPGGDITMVTAPATGVQITILRSVTATQGASLPNQGGFYPKVIENALDKLTMLTQQTNEELARCLKLSVADSITNLQDLLSTVTSAASAAGSSASAASDSASAAHGSEVAAVASAIAADNSADAAALSESSASSSASTATAQVSLAADQVALATTQAGNASTSAGTATTQAGNAAASANTATIKAGLTAADAIATAADRVQTGLDRTAASTSAGNAATSETNAAASAASAAAIANAFIGTSTTSWTPAVESKAFTTQAGELYTAGIYVTVVSAAAPTAYGWGQVTSYSGSTLTVDVQLASGSGAHTDWNISLAGVRGPTGATGAAGTVTDTSLASTTHAATSKVTPVDADELPLVDSAAANGLKKLTIANLKAAVGVEIITPTNTSPADTATGQTETPTLTGSAFYSNYGATHANTQVQVSTSSSFASPLYSSGDQAASTSFTLPAGQLSVSTTYYWRIRYKNSRGTYSDWSTATTFTTAAAFNAYITTPTATPANFGDAFEGGFYTGLIWNELIESATSTAIGTGSKTFAVSAGAAYAYSGQALEVRSRANPANKMIGTVTAANLSSVTINVTSVGGSGTFTDWSIMAQYRVIVAPKASGENASIAYKNANTAAPAACGTLTEGRAATLAMVAAGDATTYPAAWFCTGLNIGGKTDWYLPARDELELAWRNLKPTADNNYVVADRATGATPNYANLGSYGDTANTHGLDNNSSPAGAAHTLTVPGQVAAGKNFRTSESEAFAYGSYFYWSASEYSTTYAWYQLWYSSFPGCQDDGYKAGAYYVRAVRRSII